LDSTNGATVFSGFHEHGSSAAVALGHFGFVFTHVYLNRGTDFAFMVARFCTAVSASALRDALIVAGFTASMSLGQTLVVAETTILQAQNVAACYGV
jgi:hypothetical protein